MPIGILHGPFPGVGVPIGEEDQPTGVGSPHPLTPLAKDELASETPTTYIIAKDVENFLAETQHLDALSEIGEQTIERYIIGVEGEHDDRTGSPHRPILHTDEVRDLDSYVSRRPDFYPDFQPRPIHLDFRPILPFERARGHNIEVFFGGDVIQGNDPIKRWTSIGDLTLSDAAYGRNSRYWFDNQNGVLYLRIFPFFRFANLFRITYEAGRRFEKLDVPTLADDTTITMPTTWNYQTRGFVRIGKEYIFYTGKTATSLTGCQRGQFNTKPTFHAAGAMVYQVPDGVQAAVTKKVSALLLENEVFTSIVASGGEVSPAFREKVAGWKREWDEYITSTKQSWALI